MLMSHLRRFAGERGSRIGAASHIFAALRSHAAACSAESMLRHASYRALMRDAELLDLFPIHSSLLFIDASAHVSGRGVTRGRPHQASVVAY